jgi:hypothetical protein
MPETTTPRAEYQLNVRVPLETIEQARTINLATGESLRELIRRLLREEHARLLLNQAVYAEGKRPLAQHGPSGEDGAPVQPAGEE